MSNVYGQKCLSHMKLFFGQILWSIIMTQCTSLWCFFLGGQICICTIQITLCICYQVPSSDSSYIGVCLLQRVILPVIYCHQIKKLLNNERIKQSKVVYCHQLFGAFSYVLLLLPQSTQVVIINNHSIHHHPRTPWQWLTVTEVSE